MIVKRYKSTQEYKTHAEIPAGVIMIFTPTRSFKKELQRGVGTILIKHSNLIDASRSKILRNKAFISTLDRKFVAFNGYSTISNKAWIIFKEVNYGTKDN